MDERPDMTVKEAEKMYNQLSERKSALVEEFNRLRREDESIGEKMRNLRRFFHIGHSYTLTEREEPISAKESSRRDGW